MQGKQQIAGKKLAHGGNVYVSIRQWACACWKTTAGGEKAQLLPWDKIEAKYTGLFPSATDNVAKSLQLAMGTCLIQREYGYSDEEIVLQIQENPYLQWVLGMRATMTASHPSIRPPWCIFGSV